MNKLSRYAQFARNVYRNRWQIDEWLSSANSRFTSLYPPGHFYSPLPDTGEIARKAGTLFDTDVDEIPSVDLNRAGQIALITELATYYGELPFAEHASDGAAYFLDNEWFAYGDGIILYAMLRRFRPRRIIEIGSGFSSALMLETRRRFLDEAVEMLFIEPHAERLFGLMSTADRQRFPVLEQPVQDVPLERFRALEDGDILFVDSSHVVKIGSDVLHVIARILPCLKKGVIVHFHDVLWPFEYPKNWLDCGRAWNEAYFLRAFLQYNETFQVICYNAYLAARCREMLSATMPLVLSTPSSATTHGNTSLWLRKCRD